MRKMGIGLGVGINRSNYAQGIFGAYATRVVADGGVVESGSCVDAVSSLLQSASLLLIPSGYKGGKLYAQIPTNGNGDLTWTRGSDAFRTNASGVIQRVPWNLFQYSEDLSNASNWFTISATITTNTTTAPNGTLTADKLTATATTSTHILLQQPAGSVSGATSTVSIYAKSAGLSNIQFLNNAGGLGVANFNLSAGTAVLVNGVSASIENVGNGWYRCVMTYTPTTSGNYNVQIRLADSSGNTTFLGNGTDGVFLWGAQLVEGTTAQTYLPTTDRLNFPRLSYMYGSCPSALLEPQRTNLLVQSNTFTDASWGKSTSGVGIAPIVTANAGTSPDGTNNASRVQFNCVGTTSADRSFIRQTINILNATNYAGSIYVKAYSSGEIGKQLRFIWEGAANQIIITLTDSWQRVSATGVSNTTSSNFLIETRGTVTTNTTADVLIYGAQAEQGAYTTTYIPTTSATATRVADSFSRNNIYTNGLISASGGTWFVELRGNTSIIADNVTIGFWLGTNSTTPTSNGTLYFRQGGGSQRSAVWKYESGTATSLYSPTTDTSKIAIKWNGTTADIFENGTKVVSGTAFTATNMEFLATSGVGRPFFIQNMALFNSALTDAQCQTLTT